MTFVIATEEHLAAAALALIGDNAGLTCVEKEIARRAATRPGRPAVDRLQAAIQAGGDPLGDAFIAIRPPSERRRMGAVYTPSAIVEPMMSWAARQGMPARIVDPGAGSGRYILAAANRFPRARLVAIESDPLAALALRANIAARGLADRAEVLVADYRNAPVEAIEGRTLFIGNPPYVRHHEIGAHWKRWYATAAAELGIKASGLAGLHVHFFLRTRQLARPGDCGAFVTSSEWLDVNYGSTLRLLLARDLGGVELHVLEPAAMPFADAATTGAIAYFRVGCQSKSMRLRSVPSLQALAAASGGTEIPRDRIAAAPRWSVLLRAAVPSPPAGFVELGELFRVSRGQVTGCNDVWIAGPEARDLPEAVLLPTVTKARELLEAGDALADPTQLKRVVDLPSDLDALEPAHRGAVDRFLRWAKRQGAAETYIARHRPVWWAVRLYEPAPILCTYMARRPPAFVRNLCGARHINIAHGLYPRQELTDRQTQGLLAYLRKHVGTGSGRTYAGGLTKFEPRELERVAVPGLGLLHEIAADMGQRDDRSQREGGASRLPKGAARRAAGALAQDVRPLQGGVRAAVR